MVLFHIIHAPALYTLVILKSGFFVPARLEVPSCFRLPVIAEVTDLHHHTLLFSVEMRSYKLFY
jgi:hypothetical protein